MMRSLRNSLLAASLLLPSLAIAQDDPPELTGSVPFNVTSKSGRLERVAVTIGDGGTGPYKAVLWGEPSCRPMPSIGLAICGLSGDRTCLPIVAFGNGGCRNSSGEFRNFLSEIASQGFLVVAIGPAGNAVVMGGEDRQNMTAASQLLDGITWAVAENSREGSPYFHKLDVTKIAVSGQSCGSQQAIQVSGDPRVSTTVALSQGINMGPPPGGRGGAAAGTPAAAAGAPEPRAAERAGQVAAAGDRPALRPVCAAADPLSRRSRRRRADRAVAEGPRCWRKSTRRSSSSPAATRITGIPAQRRISKRLTRCRRCMRGSRWATIRPLTGNRTAARLRRPPARG